MANIEQSVENIANYQNSVRDDGVGCHRLLDELHSNISVGDAREVFSKVYQRDDSEGKSHVIDLTNGQLILLDPYKTNCGSAPAEAQPARAGDSVQPQGESIMQQLHDIHKEMTPLDKVLFYGAAWVGLSKADDALRNLNK